MNTYSDIDELTAAQVAELFSALSDTSRLRIIAALTEGEMNVGALADMIGISESAVSHHMCHSHQILRKVEFLRQDY